MILIIDNYDSFTYNLVQLAGKIQDDIIVIRNDEMTVKEVKNQKPTHIIISPGPGYPKEAGICKEVIYEMKETVPILGVCLGHQAVCETFGGEIGPAKVLIHGLPPMIEAARYHSLIVTRDTLPDELLVIGEDEDGEIMAVKHKDYEIYGLQFHPESILTPQGELIMKNFLEIGGGAI